MGPFALALKRVAISGQKFRFGKQPCCCWDDALVKLEDTAKSLHKVVLHRTVADRLFENLERLKHSRKALLQHRQEQFEPSFEMDVPRSFGTAKFLGDLSSRDTRQATRMQKLFCCPQYVRPSVGLSG